MTVPALAFPDLNKPFRIYSEASYNCTGALLSEEY